MHEPFPTHDHVPDGFAGLIQVEKAVHGSGLDPRVRELVKLRASQLNGCAYCFDMHMLDALADGEDAARVANVGVWREAVVYSDAERAALDLTDHLTRMADGGVPDAVEREARRHFADAEYAALLYAIAAINAWNRLGVAAHTRPGEYTPPGAGRRAASGG